jgi:hypothetical protein
MPNWCTNRISVSGESEDVKKLVALVRGEGAEGEFFLNSIIPMPSELEDTKAPTTEPDPPVIDGHTNWYDWRVSNWGTKWEVGEVDYYDSDDDGWVQWEFCTAWGPPEGACEKLRELFPDVSISWFYDEPGCELAGYL